MTGTASPDFTKLLDKTAEDTEILLSKLLSDSILPDEIARPKRLVDAMRYSSLGGGKRLRPFLVVASSAVFGVPREAALLAGAALECIHCYSLIHDDLPAMDNSDLRRGRPTLHKAYDDATAILAGDALLTIAFDIITRDEIHKDPTVRLLLTRALARASGLGGMVCVSFHASKTLGLEQGGAILHDNLNADPWLRRMRFDGRTERVRPKDDDFREVGFHCYMNPSTAAQGLLRLHSLSRHNRPLPNDDYPDLSKMGIFQ